MRAALVFSPSGSGTASRRRRASLLRSATATAKVEPSRFSGQARRVEANRWVIFPVAGTALGRRKNASRPFDRGCERENIGENIDESASIDEVERLGALFLSASSRRPHWPLDDDDDDDRSLGDVQPRNFGRRPSWLKAPRWTDRPGLVALQKRFSCLSFSLCFAFSRSLSADETTGVRSALRQNVFSETL